MPQKSAELCSGSGPGDCYASPLQRSTISTFHICLPALLGSHFRGVVGHTRRKVGPYLWKRLSDYLPMSSGGAIPGSPYPLGEQTLLKRRCEGAGVTSSPGLDERLRSPCSGAHTYSFISVENKGLPGLTGSDSFDTIFMGFCNCGFSEQFFA